MVKMIIIDCLGRGKGKRYATIDVIGVGPRTIAGVLEAKGVKYCLMTSEEILKYPKVLGNYDLLLTSAMISDVECSRIVKELWDRYSGGLSIIGGPITSKPTLISKLGYDVGVLGEGEYVLENLLSKITKRSYPNAGELLELMDKLKGLIININGKVHVNGIADHLTHKQLNAYKPSTKAVKFYPIYWASRVYVEVVRGCSNFYRTTIKLPNSKKCINCNICTKGSLEDRLKCPVNIPPGCGYCSVPTLFGPPRSRSIDNIVREVKELVKLSVKRIVLSAPDFLDYGRDLLVYPKPLTDPRNPPPNIDAIEELLAKLSEISEVSAGEAIVMVENIKPNLLSEEVAKVLGRYLKGTTVHLGVETGDEKHCKMLGRPNTITEVFNAVKLLVKYGLRPYAYFIHGLPGQSTRTINNTLKVMEALYRLGVEKITIYRFRPLPMSAFEKFPTPPPAVKDKLSRKLYVKARELNVKAKEKMKGIKFKAIVVSVYPPNKKYMVSYPLGHGPVILVPRVPNICRKAIVEVIVKDVVSDRVVLGEVTRILSK